MRFIIDTYFQPMLGDQFRIKCTNEGVIPGDDLSFSLESYCVHVKFRNEFYNDWCKNPVSEELTKAAIESCKYCAHRAMNEISGNLLHSRVKYPNNKESVFDKLADPKVLLAWYDEVDAAIEDFFYSKREKAIA